jgi:hypothetical protein
MNDARLLQVLGLFAVLGGVLRVASAFVPWAPDVASLEALYLVIDVMLLFGLMGVYFAYRNQLGVFGFVAFAIAEAGIASIVGPDSVSFGIDTYQVGVQAIAVGLALLSVVMLLKRAGPAVAAICWIASLVVGAGGGAIGEGAFGFFLGGVLFGLGFVAAGIALLMPAAKTA